MRNAFVMVCFSSLLINYIPAKDSYENAYPGATWAPPSNLFFYVSVLSLFVFDLFHFYRIFPSRILDNRRTTHIAAHRRRPYANKNSVFTCLLPAIYLSVEAYLSSAISHFLRAQGC